MRLISLCLCLPMVATIILLGGCTQAPAQGDLQVLISDHRDAIGDFSRFLVEIESIELHPAGQAPDEGWVGLETRIQQIDLTQLVGDESQQVVAQRLATDRYDALKIDITSVHGTLINGEDIALDDFSAIGRLEFQLARDETITLLVDLKVQSQHDHPGRGYLLLLGEVRQVSQNSTE